MDIEALKNEMTAISERWNELDNLLTDNLVRFKNWMQAEFPKPSSAGFYDQHLPFRLYPAAVADCAGAFLDMESPFDAESFIFTARDRDGATYVVRLPFAWIQDAREFRATLQAQVDAEQAKLDAAEPARKEALRKLSAARDEVRRLEAEIYHA